ncbi:MAG: efflux transporter, family, subunit [Planctomycetaceae bacterium]|nr:efflux transporter, family, subunit [Planctomycetaceae bacterium]
MTQSRSLFVRWVFLISVTAAIVAGVFWNRDRLMSLLRPTGAAKLAEHPPQPISEAKVLKLSEQARKNLGLVSKPAKPQTYWRTIQVPGAITDRPGKSDRGVTSPVVGVVTQVHAFPGDTVHPGDRLFTLRLISEYIQNTQSELFKATKESQLISEEKVRIETLAKTGTVPGSKLIELNQQLRRQLAAIQGYRQDLLTRGLNPGQIEGVTEGQFVASIEVFAPPALPATGSANSSESKQEQLVDDATTSLAYEVQDLKVDLGTQVQAGQLLSVLANHHSLYIAGHAFKQDAPFLEKAAQNAWPINVEFSEDDHVYWPTLNQTFHIRHLSNSIDVESRTFDFFIPLTNQSRGYEQDGRTFVVWRFRPGQRARLHVPVEELKDVIVLPAAAVVREGPEAYVFRQNGDLFNRLPVHVLHEDRLNVVIANDGSVTPGLYLAQSSAASLNRVLKAQAASGMRADVHVHADGTTHAPH